MPTVLAHEPDARRYTMITDGELVSVLDYAINGEQISFTRSYTNPARRGQGHAGRLVEFAVDDVAATSTRRIVPMCWYVGEWFDRHPERAGLLTR